MSRNTQHDCDLACGIHTCVTCISKSRVTVAIVSHEPHIAGDRTVNGTLVACNMHSDGMREVEGFNHITILYTVYITVCAKCFNVSGPSIQRLGSCMSCMRCCACSRQRELN